MDKANKVWQSSNIYLFGLNLELDIREKTNLVDNFPEKASELHILLKNWRNQLDAPVPEELYPEYKNYSE